MYIPTNKTFSFSVFRVIEREYWVLNISLAFVIVDYWKRKVALYCFHLLEASFCTMMCDDVWCVHTLLHEWIYKTAFFHYLLWELQICYFLYYHDNRHSGWKILFLFQNINFINWPSFNPNPLLLHITYVFSHAIFNYWVLIILLNFMSLNKKKMYIKYDLIQILFI